MIHQVAQVLSDTLTVNHMVYFVGGWLSGFVFRKAHAAAVHKRLDVNWRAVVIFMSWVVLVYVTFSTYRNNQCVAEFNRILKVRSDITAQDQSISLEQHRLVYGLIHNVVFPPHDIAVLDPDDPIRQQYIVQQFINVDRSDTDLFAQQSNNETERAKNPLPNPTCS